MKKIAHCIHHTHWDLIWYFTAQDAAVQFSYNMKEMLEGFRTNRIENFFMDGQTMPIDEYLGLHPEDEAYIKQLVTDGKLIIGPFNSQLDCFICNGESVVNNLRLGMKTARKLGKISRVAYLPDSFGHSYDFPKIFHKFGIKDFVITRGVGDNYHVDSEFYMQSNDGSQLLVCTMIAGYGYGCDAFKEGTLFSDCALDYNKIRVTSLIDRLLNYSTLKNEFVFPLGFDQNPAIFDIPDKIVAYNNSNDEFEFRSTTWDAYCKRVRSLGKDLKLHKGELFSTQYHRVHKSLFSARSDIKALQDKCERVLTYELQPLMSMLDSLGIAYDHGLMDRAWETLVRCQTHSTATLTDETNDYIERETKNALGFATSTKVYLMKLVSISLAVEQEETSSLIVYHTLPIKRKMIIEAKVFSKTQNFAIINKGQPLSFSLKKAIRKNCGVLRKDTELMDPTKYYYECDIVLETSVFHGISYQTYDVVACDEGIHGFVEEVRSIENEYYKIYQDEDGIVIRDKALQTIIKQAIYLEESGDEGDSFDYSYPSHDLILKDYFDSAHVTYQSSKEMSDMKITGTMQVPSSLQERKQKQCTQNMEYEITISLKKESKIIELKGNIYNQAKQHRVRFVVHGLEPNEYSLAGTQYGYIQRETYPKEMETWKKEQWFEEPSPTFPLLNHVSTCSKRYTVSILTRSSKEYEFISNGYSDIAITLFRSYGAMGYPDLHRRPGRPSGLDYMVFETPNCQMQKTNSFELAITYHEQYDANRITNLYIAYACEASYYQKQNFDKSINPIAYFPTNPLPKQLPTSYEFLCLDNFEGNFGSIVKADHSDGYITRLYNSENKEIKGGKLVAWEETINVYESNFEEETLKSLSPSSLPNIKKGGLIALKLSK